MGLAVPAEVDLDPRDPITVEGEDLGVPAAPAIGPDELVGHDHLVARFDQALDVDPLSAPRSGPALLEEAGSIEARIRGAREDQLVSEVPLEEVPVPGREGLVEPAGELLAIG